MATGEVIGNYTGQANEPTKHNSGNKEPLDWSRGFSGDGSKAAVAERKNARLTSLSVLQVVESSRRSS
jgi:hypothetical protein